MEALRLWFDIQCTWRIWVDEKLTGCGYMSLAALILNTEGIFTGSKTSAGDLMIEMKQNDRNIGWSVVSTVDIQ